MDKNILGQPIAGPSQEPDFMKEFQKKDVIEPDGSIIINGKKYRGPSVPGGDPELYYRALKLFLRELEQ